MAKVLITEKYLEDIADAIRAKHGTEAKYTPALMATAITNIPSGGGLPEEAFVFTGNCEDVFKGHWTWFLDEFIDRITTEDITNASRMFLDCQKEVIPFDINLTNNAKMVQLFMGCNKLKQVPKINTNFTPPTSQANAVDISSLFNGCRSLVEIPYDFFTSLASEEFWTASAKYDIGRNAIFRSCVSLRRLPDISCLKSTPTNYAFYVLYYDMANDCRCLDEIIDLPVLDNITLSKNMFSGTCNYCYRLKNITFKLDNGNPYVVNWSNQHINLSSTYNIGWCNYSSAVNEGGIPKDKEVKDDATYQALKNDPDWYSIKREYARYNHDSAVATINSLPDTSAYLATAGGTNTIQFYGSSGSLTDGGAISNLTPEEIAVATAKGWTVSFG